MGTYTPYPILDIISKDSRQLACRHSCVCSWALNWLPIGPLQCFGYDTETFPRRLHDEEHTLHRLGRDLETWFQNLAKLSDALFELVSRTLCRTATTSFRICLDCLSLKDTSAMYLSKNPDRHASDHIAKYDAILSQAICTAIELAYNFIAFHFEKRGMAIIEQFQPDLVDFWLREQGYEGAMHDLFSDYARDIITKDHSSPSKDVPIRSLEVYRRHPVARHLFMACCELYSFDAYDLAGPQPLQRLSDAYRKVEMADRTS
jgi:hypothetical protein